MTHVPNNSLFASFQNVTIETNKEQKEKIRFINIAAILEKVCSNIELTENETIELRNEVKISDLKDRALLVKKDAVSFIVNYSDNSFNFLNKAMTTSSKRVPLQILAVKYGSCLNYLLSLGFSLDIESTKVEYSKLFAKLATKLAKDNSEADLSNFKVAAKFEVRKYGAALKISDVNRSITENVIYGTASQKTLDIFAAKAAKEAEKAALLIEAENAKIEAAKALLIKTQKAEKIVNAKAEKLAENQKRYEIAKAEKAALDAVKLAAAKLAAKKEKEAIKAAKTANKAA